MKWRKVPAFAAEAIRREAASNPNARWRCLNNVWDPAHSDCTCPEEEWGADEDVVAMEGTTLHAEAVVAGMWLDAFCVRKKVWYEAQVLRVQWPPTPEEQAAAKAREEEETAVAKANEAASAAPEGAPAATMEEEEPAKRTRKKAKKSAARKKGGAAGTSSAPVLPRARILFHNCPHKRNPDGEWIALTGDGLARLARHHTHTVVTSDKLAGWQQQLDAATGGASAGSAAKTASAGGAAHNVDAIGSAHGTSASQSTTGGAPGVGDASGNGSTTVGASLQREQASSGSLPSVDELLQGSPWYVAMEDETPSAIAHKLGVSAKALVTLNRDRYKGLQAGSRLMARTKLLVPARETSGDAGKHKKRGGGSTDAATGGAGTTAGDGDCNGKGGSAELHADDIPAVACQAVAGFDLGLGVWGNAAGITMLGSATHNEGEGSERGAATRRRERAPAVVIPNKRARAIAKVEAYVAALPEKERMSPSQEALEAEGLGISVERLRVLRERDVAAAQQQEENLQRADAIMRRRAANAARMRAVREAARQQQGTQQHGRKPKSPHLVTKAKVKASKFIKKLKSYEMPQFVDPGLIAAALASGIPGAAEAATLIAEQSCVAVDEAEEASLKRQRGLAASSPPFHVAGTAIQLRILRGEGGIERKRLGLSLAQDELANGKCRIYVSTCPRI